MNVPALGAWVVVALLAILSIVLLSGKGGFLIAGYNTASKETKRKYDVKKLCRVVGGGIGVCAVILAVTVLYDFEGFVIPWLMPIAFLAVVAVVAVLANTICGAKHL